MLFVDTDVVIGYGRGHPATVAFVEAREAAGDLIAVTAVNAAELYRGASGAQRPTQAVRAVHEILQRIPVLPLDEAAARRFGDLTARLDRSGRPVPVPDALVAAIVLENGGRLATANRRHFDRVPGLEVVEPAA